MNQNDEYEQICGEAGCEKLTVSSGYCREHYIKNWAALKRKEQILREGSLNKFIEDLAERYPLEILTAVRHDLSSDDAFERVKSDLEIQDDLEEGVEEAYEIDLEF